MIYLYLFVARAGWRLISVSCRAGYCIPSAGSYPPDPLAGYYVDFHFLQVYDERSRSC